MLGVYVWHSLCEIVALFRHLDSITEANLMLATLSAVDGTMVANLVAFIMIGSYATFVRPLTFRDCPHWLQNISSGDLKLKMSTSLIGITSIHLLRDFVDAEAQTAEMLYKHVGLHIIFLVSAMAVAWVDKTTHAPANSIH